MARILAEVISANWNEYDGKKGHVKELILSMVDKSPELPRIKCAFDYVCSPEEESVIGHPRNILDKRVLLGIEEPLEWGGHGSFSRCPAGDRRQAPKWQSR